MKRLIMILFLASMMTAVAAEADGKVLRHLGEHVQVPELVAEDLGDVGGIVAEFEPVLGAGVERVHRLHSRIITSFHELLESGTHLSQELIVMVMNAFKASLKWIVLIVIIIVALVLYSRHRKKVWKRRFRTLDPSTASLSKHKKKKLWKKTKKERRRANKAQKRQAREIEAVKHEEDGFSIFKKKERKGPRPEKVTATKIDDSVFDDIEFD